VKVIGVFKERVLKK